MKILFLDVDGVLNNEQTTTAITTTNYRGYRGLDPVNIDAFKYVIEAVPDVKVVLSSTWRFFYKRQDFQKLLADYGLVVSIIDETPRKMSYISRVTEIRMWLDDNPEVKTYVAVDDDPSIVGLVDHHVLTDPYTGFVEHDIAKVVSLLK